MSVEIQILKNKCADEGEIEGIAKETESSQVNYGESNENYEIIIFLERQWLLKE